MCNYSTKLSLVLFAVLLTLGMATSCGGGGGGGGPQVIPVPGSGNPPGTLIPIPGQIVPSLAIDTPKVVAAINGGGGGLVIQGLPGAAMANAEVKAIDSNTIEAFTTAAADGSFSFAGFPPGFNGVSGATILLCQTAPSFGESLTISINVI